jgi:hypothetical protein
MNPAWEAVTGLSRAATVGRTLLETLPAVEPAWIETFVGVAETGEPANFEGGLALLGKWYSVHAFRTEPDRFAAIFLDITARRAAEERQALMSREVDHRAKNALSVALAAVRLTRAPDMESYVEAVEGRVAALAPRDRRSSPRTVGTAPTWERSCAASWTLSSPAGRRGRGRI